MLLRENTMEASFFHFSLLHPTVTLSANPAGLSPKIYPQTSPAFDYTAGQNCCHFPLHYYIHLLTTLFAYAFVLTKSMVHTVIWVIILKTKTAISLLSWVAIAFSCPILLKIKIQRPYNDLALLSPVYLLSLITFALSVHMGFVQDGFFSPSLNFSSIITFSEIFLRSLHIKQHPLYKPHLFYIAIFFILLFFFALLYFPPCFLLSFSCTTK